MGPGQTLAWCATAVISAPLSSSAERPAVMRLVGPFPKDLNHPCYGGRSLCATCQLQSSRRAMLSAGGPCLLLSPRSYWGAIPPCRGGRCRCATAARTRSGARGASPWPTRPTRPAGCTVIRCWRSCARRCQRCAPARTPPAPPARCRQTWQSCSHAALPYPPSLTAPSCMEPERCTVCQIYRMTASMLYDAAFLLVSRCRPWTWRVELPSLLRRDVKVAIALMALPRERQSRVMAPTCHQSRPQMQHLPSLLHRHSTAPENDRPAGRCSLTKIHLQVCQCHGHSVTSALFGRSPAAGVRMLH